MIDRRFFAEAAAIVGAAVLCAAVANFVAGRDKKLAVVGNYPNALTVPKKESPAPTPVEAPPAATANPSTLSAEPMSSPAASSSAPAHAAAPATAAPSTASKPPKSAAASAAPAASPAKSFAPHPDKPWIEIAGADVSSLFRAKALFLDARRTSVFAEGHIPGARSFAVWEADVDDKVKALLDEGIDSAAPIVVYCTGGHCEDSHMLSDKLYKVGFNNALVYKDGFPDWEKRGEPVAKGMPQ